MPAFVGWIGHVLVGLVGSIIGRIFVSLGLAIVYYRGVDVALGWLKDKFYVQIAAMPLIVQQIIGTLQLSTCVNIIFTALMIRVTLLGLNGEGFKRLVYQ